MWRVPSCKSTSVLMGISLRKNLTPPCCMVKIRYSRSFMPSIRWCCACSCTCMCGSECSHDGILRFTSNVGPSGGSWRYQWNTASLFARSSLDSFSLENSHTPYPKLRCKDCSCEHSAHRAHLPERRESSCLPGPLLIVTSILDHRRVCSMCVQISCLNFCIAFRS